MKKLFYIILLLSLLLLLPFECYCTEASATLQNAQDYFFEGLDGELYDMLDSFGLDSLDPDALFTSSTESIKEYFTDTLKEKLQGAASWFFLCIAIVTVLSLVSTAFDFSLSDDALLLFSSSAICLVTMGKISSFLNCVLSSMALNGKLMLAFIPAFALLLSLSGNPTSALTYNSLMMLFCQVISLFLENLFVSVVGLYFCLSISLSFNPNVNLNRFINGASRLLSLTLGLCGTLFTGALSLKGVLSAATDSLSVRGVRFLIGNLVPVIGSSLSEAYSSVLGSINLMKGSLAVVGILALVIINIPAFTEGVIYYFLITVLSCFAEILGLQRPSEVFRSLAGCVKLLLVVCLFQVFILIISTGLMLTVRGGAVG